MGNSSWKLAGYQVFGCCTAGKYLSAEHNSRFVTIQIISFVDGLSVWTMLSHHRQHRFLLAAFLAVILK